MPLIQTFDESCVYAGIGAGGVGHILIFINPIWAAFTYLGGLFLATGGLIIATRG